MGAEGDLPFSTRVGDVHSQVENDFPASARMGLLHVLHDMVERRYVSNWVVLAREVERLARVKPTFFGGDAPDFAVQAALSTVEEHVLALEWQRVVDLIENIHSRLCEDVVQFSWDGEPEVLSTKADAREHFAACIRNLFLEEHLALSILDGVVSQTGRLHTTRRVAKAQLVLGDPRLERARWHYNKANRLFRDPETSDPFNVIKEAVCALEAAAKALSDSKSSDFSRILASMTGTAPGQIPHAIKTSLSGLYSYRGAGDGISHGSANGGAPTAPVAEFVLASVASGIVLLYDLREGTHDSDIPF